MADIETKVAESKKSVSVLRDAQKVRATPEFTAFALPRLRADEVRSVLSATLSDIDQEAVAAVTAHFEEIGARAEAWISEGVERLGGKEHCAFCGQETTGLSLVAHYRAYFSNAYREHKTRIANAKTWLDQNVGGDALARIQRSMQQAKDRHAFWAKYIDLPELKFEVDEVGTALTEARDALLSSLAAKTAAPLEQGELDADGEAAVTRYEAVADEIRLLCESLLQLNESVSTAKEKAQHGSLPTAESQLAQLEATRRRHEKEKAALCAAYVQAKEEKAVREKEKEAARKALKEHREKVFGTYQAAINGFLVKFNADFQIERLEPSDARGVPSSSYEFIVNKTSVQTSPTKEAKPSFATVLSTGDRSTLALAFFFASLQERGTLDDTIIVIDDPASSLDDGRAFATVQEIRALVGKAEQVVVLAHSRQILCQLWERAEKESTATIEIRDEQGVPDASTLESWDAEAATVTEFDRQHALVREYAENSKGDAQDVAVALRPVLEGFLRVAFVESCPPGRMLGDFLSLARQAKQDGSPIMSDDQLRELDNLREYANQFHHSTNDWQENRANVNEQALRGYARRVIEFTRIARP